MEAVGAVAPSVARPRESRFTQISCRTLDVVVAGIALIVLSPLLALIALIIRLDSKGWPIFRQGRVGRELKPFTVNKFRTMKAGAGHETHRTYVLKLINGDHETGDGTDRPVLKIQRDARITRVGRFLRKSSLDELPQLWNVLRGDMSLVGPRPPIPYEVEHYPAHWFARFAVKPGVTGLWQVSGRSQLTHEEMIRLDVEYVHNRSLGLNLKILLMTIPAVLFARGAA